LSLSRNAVANFISQIFVVLVGVLMLPLYIEYMGVEAFGLIGFYATLQALFQLLDMGLAPTMTRETARYIGGATDVLSLRRLLRVLECIFLSIAIVGVLFMFVASEFIVDSWLNFSQLSNDEVHRSVILISITVVLRWVCVLYRGVIIGFEKFIWLSGFNIIIATSRFVLVLPLLILVSATPSFYFAYQTIIALAELLILIAKGYKLFPKINTTHESKWDWIPLRKALKFSLTAGFASIVGIFSTQLDKITLSHLLPLSEYGHFTLAILAASGVAVVGAPIGAVLLPRLTKLNAEMNFDSFERLYRTATQLVGVIAIPAAFVLALFPEQILWVWTGDPNTSSIAAPILSLFAIGNGLYIYAAFPYYMQFAKGDLKLHILSSIAFVLVYFPMLLWLTITFGTVGAGFAWILANSILLIFWSPVVHRRFAPGLHSKWLLLDIVPIILLALASSFLLSKMVTFPHARLHVGALIVAISTAVVMVAALGSSQIRLEVRKRLGFE
jgi:O-antigen/teichoic acid export membrane protein